MPSPAVPEQLPEVMQLRNRGVQGVNRQIRVRPQVQINGRVARRADVSSSGRGESVAKAIAVFITVSVTACFVYGFYLEAQKGWQGDKNFSWYNTGCSTIIVLAGASFLKALVVPSTHAPRRL